METNSIHRKNISENQYKEGRDKQTQRVKEGMKRRGREREREGERDRERGRERRGNEEKRGTMVRKVVVGGIGSSVERIDRDRLWTMIGGVTAD